MNIFNGIQWRIAGSYVLLILVSMGVLGLFMADFVEDERIDDLRLQLEGEARLVAETAVMLLADGVDGGRINPWINSLGNQIDARVTIVAADGTVLGDSAGDPQSMENHSDRPEIKDAIAIGLGQITRYSSTLDQKMMYVAVPIEKNGDVLGIARVSLSTEKIDDFVGDMMRTVVPAMAIVTVIAVLGAIYIARVTARPIRLVTAAAKRISSGQMDQQILTNARGETAELAAAFNEMSGNLRTMIGDLSTQTGKLSAVLDTMDDGVVMTDVDGNIGLANPAAGRLFGFDAQDSVGRRLVATIPDHEVNEIFRAYLKTGRHQARQIEQVRTGKLIRVIVSRIFYHDAFGALLMFQDLTEVSRLQATRQKFIANVSHELRTPLASIKAVTDTLSEGIVTDPEMVADFLSRIDGEVDRMTHIVSELTELSRIETGQMQLQLVPVDLADLVDDCILRVISQAQRGQLEIGVSLEDDLPMVMVDGERMRQVFVNLLHNAIKFTPKNGVITISAQRESNRVTVSVADTGIGIAADDLPHVFERFYKADKARSSEGTGLGLSIAKHIIKAHGGDIRVESEPGNGAVFEFDLPVA